MESVGGNKAQDAWTQLSHGFDANACQNILAGLIHLGQAAPFSSCHLQDLYLLKDKTMIGHESLGAKFVSDDGSTRWVIIHRVGGIETLGEEELGNAVQQKAIGDKFGILGKADPGQPTAAPPAHVEVVVRSAPSIRSRSDVSVVRKLKGEGERRLFACDKFEIQDADFGPEGQLHFQEVIHFGDHDHPTPPSVKEVVVFAAAIAKAFPHYDIHRENCYFFSRMFIEKFKARGAHSNLSSESLPSEAGSAGNRIIKIIVSHVESKEVIQDSLAIVEPLFQKNLALLSEGQNEVLSSFSDCCEVNLLNHNLSTSRLQMLEVKMKSSASNVSSQCYPVVIRSLVIGTAVDAAWYYLAPSVSPSLCSPCLYSLFYTCIFFISMLN